LKDGCLILAETDHAKFTAQTLVRPPTDSALGAIFWTRKGVALSFNISEVFICPKRHATRIITKLPSFHSTKLTLALPAKPKQGASFHTTQAKSS